MEFFTGILEGNFEKRSATNCTNEHGFKSATTNISLLFDIYYLLFDI